MKRSISFWLLLLLGTATVVFNSCGKDDDSNNPTTIAVSFISLDKQTLTLVIDEDYTLTATVLPENATDITVTWISNSDAIATVSNGKVIAISEGAATITAKAGNQTTDCVVAVIKPLTFDEVVEINGVRWTTRNLGASSSCDYGGYYQFNRGTTDFLLWEDYYNSVYAQSDSWLPANDPSPSGYHVPTLTEIQSLLNTIYVRSEWITLNGVNGRKFTDKNSGNSIFLPAAGYRDYYYGTLGDIGLYGYYWSSTVFDSSHAYYLGFLFHSSDAGWWGLNNRNNGLTVRAVAD